MMSSTRPRTSLVTQVGPVGITCALIFNSFLMRTRWQFCPGWQGSAGARLEVAIARELGIPIWDSTYDGEVLYRESALLEAHRLVHGDRGHNYGHPIEDFQRTANIWNVLFGGKADGSPFEPHDVPLAMIAVKLSRETHITKRDNRVDIAGYAETAEMVYEKYADRS